MDYYNVITEGSYITKVDTSLPFKNIYIYLLNKIFLRYIFICFLKRKEDLDSPDLEILTEKEKKLWMEVFVDGKSPFEVINDFIGQDFISVLSEDVSKEHQEYPREDVPDTCFEIVMQMDEDYKESDEIVSVVYRGNNSHCFTSSALLTLLSDYKSWLVNQNDINGGFLDVPEIYVNLGNPRVLLSLEEFIQLIVNPGVYVIDNQTSVSRVWSQLNIDPNLESNFVGTEHGDPKDSPRIHIQLVKLLKPSKERIQEFLKEAFTFSIFDMEALRNDGDYPYFRESELDELESFDSRDIIVPGIRNIMKTLGFKIMNISQESTLDMMENSLNQVPRLVNLYYDNCVIHMNSKVEAVRKLSLTNCTIHSNGKDVLPACKYLNLSTIKETGGLTLEKIMKSMRKCQTVKLEQVSLGYFGTDDMNINIDFLLTYPNPPTGFLFGEGINLPSLNPLSNIKNLDLSINLNSIEDKESLCSLTKAFSIDIKYQPSDTHYIKKAKATGIDVIEELIERDVFTIYSNNVVYMKKASSILFFDYKGKLIQEDIERYLSSWNASHIIIRQVTDRIEDLSFPHSNHKIKSMSFENSLIHKLSIPCETILFKECNISNDFRLPSTCIHVYNDRPILDLNHFIHKDIKLLEICVNDLQNPEEISKIEGKFRLVVMDKNPSIEIVERLKENAREEAMSVIYHLHEDLDSDEEFFSDEEIQRRTEVENSGEDPFSTPSNPPITPHVHYLDPMPFNRNNTEVEREPSRINRQMAQRRLNFEDSDEEM